MLLNLFNRRQTVIAPYTGYRNAEKLHVSARVLRQRPEREAAKNSFSKFLHLLSLYASDEVPHAKVTLHGYGQEVTKAANDEGFVHFEIDLDDIPLPLHAEWESVTLSLSAKDHVPVPAPVLVPGTDGRLGIISDIDDTIIETGATDFIRNWRRVLVQLPDDRIMVPGAADMYRTLGAASKPDMDAPLTRPFFYVSSSPWNLFGFLTRFMEINNIPPGVLMLRDWDFSPKTLGNSSHGEHKRRQIESILEFYPDMRFVLIGDYTQGDAEAFAQIVKNDSARIAAVFIRTAEGEKLRGIKAVAADAIRDAGVPIWTGPAFDEGKDFLAGINLASPQEVGEIVETMKETDETA